MSVYKHVLQTMSEFGAQTRDSISGQQRKVLPGISLRIDLIKQFPLTTLTTINLKQTMAELCWNLANTGNSNAKKLLELGGEDKLDVCNPDGLLIGTVGGSIRAWPHMVWTSRTNVESVAWDQLTEFEYRLKTDSHSGNLILSCVNPLTELHASEETEITSIQCIRVGDRLHTIVNIHQVEVIDRLPKLMFMLGIFAKAAAQIADRDLGDLVLNIGVCHVREQNYEALRTLHSREEKGQPTVNISDEVTTLIDLPLTAITVENYQPHAALVKPALAKA